MNRYDAKARKQATTRFYAIALALTIWLVPASSAAEFTAKRPQIAILTLWPEGFDQKTIQLKPGHVLLYLRNRTGRRDVNVSIKSTSTAKDMTATPLTAGARAWTPMLNLESGTYVVTQAGKSAASCQLIVK